METCNPCLTIKNESHSWICVDYKELECFTTHVQDASVATVAPTVMVTYNGFSLLMFGSAPICYVPTASGHELLM